MNTRKRLIVLLIAAVMLCGLLPLGVFADDVENYELWIGGTQVTSENCSDIPGVEGENAKAYYDPAANTLTLENAEGIVSSSSDTLIIAGDNLTLNLVGNSKITVDGVLYAMHVGKTLTVTGEGSLTFDVVCCYDDVIYVGALIMQSGAMKVTGVLPAAEEFSVISAKYCYFTGGTFEVDADIDEKDVYSTSVGCIIRTLNKCEIGDGAVFKAKIGGRLPQYFGKTAYLIYSPIFNVKGGEFSLDVSEAGNRDYDYLSYAALYCDIIDISGGSLSVNSPKFVYAMRSSQATVSGGSVAVSSGERGIYSAELSVSGGVIRADVNASSDETYAAIEVRNNLTVTGGSITATARDKGCGIFSGDSATFKGGRVHAKGKHAILAYREDAPGNYSSIEVTDNAFVSFPEGALHGEGTFISEGLIYRILCHTIRGEDSLAVPEAIISPRLSCCVSKNGGESEECWWQYGGDNSGVYTKFSVPVGESWTVTLTAEEEDYKLNYIYNQGVITDAHNDFLDTTYSVVDRKSIVFEFAPTYLPTGNTHYGTSNARAGARVFLSPDGSDSVVYMVGSIILDAVPGDLTVGIDDIVVPKGGKVSVPVTIKNGVGTELSQPNFSIGILTDNVFNNSEYFEPNAAYFVKKSGKYEVYFAPKSGCPDAEWDITVEWTDRNGDYNPATVTFSLRIVCPCELGILEHYDAADATCVKAGSAEYWECSECGKYFSDENGGNEITDKSSVVIPAHGHTPLPGVEKNRVEPTCETDGGYDIVVYCGICGDELSRKSERIAATDHAWGEWFVEREPTDREKGIEKRVCGNNETHFETRELDTVEYKIDTVIPEHGGVEISPKDPKSGDGVIITPKPDEGYEVDEVKVTDKDGGEIAVKKNGDGTYAFTMPERDVKIGVTYKAAPAPDAPETGDGTRAVLRLTLLALAALGVCVLISRRTRRKATR